MTTSTAARPFLDSNVVIYAFGADPGRTATAQKLLQEGGVVSVQVLNEFVDVARRRLGLSWDEIAASLEALRALVGDAEPLTTASHALALEISWRHGYRIYDSQIIATAKLAGCETLLTEDMGNGQVIQGVRLRNPFASGPG